MDVPGGPKCVSWPSSLSLRLTSPNRIYEYFYVDHLWGGGGSPFKPLANGNVKDRSGTEVKILADLRDILIEVKSEDKWKDTRIGVASSCDEPAWAYECISKIQIGKFQLKEIFEPGITEIYKNCKTAHLKEISQKTRVDLRQMMFFDNEWSNCQAVARLGVTVVYTPRGLTQELYQEALQKFPETEGKIIGKRR